MGTGRGSRSLPLCGLTGRHGRVGLLVDRWGKDSPAQETHAEKVENIRSPDRLAGDRVGKEVGPRCESLVIPSRGFVLGLTEICLAECTILLTPPRRIGELLPFPVLYLLYFLGCQKANNLAPGS